MDRMQMLHTLIERELRRRDAALADWREAQRQVETAHEQCDALITYRGEYRKRWAAQFQTRSTMEILRCYQGFVERLDQAIGSQQANVAQAEQRLMKARDGLRQRETRLAMVRKLMERRLSALAQHMLRRDQRASDEAAQRIGWAARQALSAG